MVVNGRVLTMLFKDELVGKVLIGFLLLYTVDLVRRETDVGKRRQRVVDWSIYSGFGGVGDVRRRRDSFAAQVDIADSCY